MLNELLTPTDNPADDLIRFGDVFMPVILTEQSCWDRLAAAESMIHPEVGEAFFNAGPARVIKKLKDYLAHQHQAGQLQVKKPARAAEQLIGLMLGIDLLRAQVGKKPPSRAALKTKCREAVALFLATYGLANE